MEKQLHIIGKGSLTLAPTITSIVIKFDDVLPTYKEALSKSVKDANEMKDVFTNLGFNKTDLKTIRFDIRAKFKDVYKNSVRTEVFEGFQYNQEFKIKFKNDNNLLSKILTKLSNCISNPKFSISYEIENKEQAKKDAIRLAVIDAKEKAEAIALAAGVNLLTIDEIHYSDHKNNYDMVMYDCCMSKSACNEDYYEDDFNVDFNPEDLTVSEEVAISWNIR